MKKINWAVFVVVVLVFGFFIAATPARAVAATELQSEGQQLALLSSYLDSLKGLLSSLQNLLSVSSAYAYHGWSSEIWGGTHTNTNLNYGNVTIYFCYASSPLPSDCSSSKTFLQVSTNNAQWALGNPQIGWYYRFWAEGTNAVFSNMLDVAYSAPVNAGDLTIPVAPFSPTTAPTTAPTVTINAVSPNSTSHTLYWNGIADASFFKLYRRLNGGSWELREPSRIWNFYMDQLLANGTYDYYIQACNAYGCSPNSNTVTGTIGSGSSVPATPVISIAAPPASPNANANTLSWNAVSGATSYTLYHRVSGGSWTTVVSGLTSTSINDGTLAAGTYEYHVNACNSSGCSADSNIVSGTIPFTMPTLIGNLAQNNSVELSWNSVAGSSGFYRGFRYPSGGSLTTIFDNYANTTYTNTNLSAGTYNFYIVVCNSSNVCSVSNTVTLTVSSAGDTQAPSVPTGLLATPTSPSQINLSWSASTDNVGVTGYKIYRGGTLWYIQTGLSFSDTGLSSNTSYNYYVQAYDAVGNVSPTSTAVFATTQSGTVSCSGLTLTFQNNKTSYVVGETVTYTYVCSPGGTTSFIEVSMVKPDSSITVYNSASGSISQNTMGFGTSNLSPGNYTLRTCFTAGCSGGVTASLPFTITASTSVPPTPANVSVVIANNAASNSTLNLTWGGTTSNITSFRVYQRLQGFAWPSTYDTRDISQIVSSTQTTLTVQVAVVWNGSGTYDFKVQACNSAGCSSDSNIASTAVSGTTSDATTSCTIHDLTLQNGKTAYTVSEYLIYTMTWTCPTGVSSSSVGVQLQYPDSSSIGMDSMNGSSPRTITSGIGGLTPGTYILKACYNYANQYGTINPCTVPAVSRTITVGSSSDGTTTSTAASSTTSSPSPSPSPSSTSTAPSAPSNFNYNLSNGGATVNVTWQDNSTNENWFTVSRQLQGGSWVTLGNISTNVTSASDTPPAGTYYYQVSACSTNLCSAGIILGPITLGTTSGTAYPTSTLTVPYVDIKVDGSDGTAYRAAAASYTLSWNASGAATCTASGTWGGEKNIPSGSQYFTGVTVLGTKTYTLACSNSYGSSRDTVYVEITPAPSTGATSTAVTGSFLQGTVIDASGKLVSGVYVHVYSDGFGLNFSAITDAQGAFGMSVPAGTYWVELSPPSTRTDVARPAPQKVSVESGEVKTVTLQFSAPAKTISGIAVFSNGQPITDAEVGAYSSVTNQWVNAFTDGNGTFTVRVSGGAWQVGIRPRNPLVATWSAPSTFSSVTFTNDASSETRFVNFTIPVLDAKVTVHVVNQNNEVLVNAGVVVDVVGAGQAPLPGADLPPPVFRKSDGSGTASFSLKTGTYFIRAFLPPELGFFNPPEASLMLAAGQSKDVTLVFRKHDVVPAVTLKGIVRLEDGAPIDAFVWAWSEKGDTVQARSVVDGTFSFPATKGRWHIGSGKEFGGFSYKSSELTVDVDGPVASVEITIMKIGKPLAPPVEVSQSATEQIIAQAQDGAKVTVPEGAVASGGTVNVEVRPTIEAPSQAAAKVVSTVYDVNITSDGGTAVTTLRKDIEITIPYNEADLAKQGATEDTFVPSYYDETTGTWVKVDNYTIDKEKNVVIVRVKHLTRFALVSAADITPPLAPANVSVKKGVPGETVLSWMNPTTDFSHIKIYRSTTAGEFGKLVANNIQGTSVSDTTVMSGTKYYYTVRSVDPAGNESANTTQVSVTASGVFAGGLPPGQATKAAILRTLQTGSTGDDVKALQELLLKEGVYPDGLVTGYFGNLTKQAVIRFQEKYASEILTPNGLTAGTGTVGPSTRAKVNVLLGATGGSIAPTPAPALPPGQATKAAILRNLSAGSSGDDVTALQELLLKEGVYPDGLVTSYFGNLTKQAVIRFQEKYASEILTPNGLSSGNGFVGPATRAKVSQLLK